jgi:hypothetical protein
MLLITLLALLPVDIEVHAPGCVERDAVVVAVDAVGGIDVVEHVRVLVERDAGDDAHLVIELELIGAPPLHREAPLLPVECADVADLTAFLVQQQREQARHTPPRQLPAPERPRLRAARQTYLREVQSCGSCERPAWENCGGLRLSASIGALAMPDGYARFAFDVGYSINEHVAPVLTFETTGTGPLGLTAALQARAQLAIVEASVRVGLRATVAPLTFGPQAAVRARVGYGFVDVGGLLRVGTDGWSPGGFVAVGIALGE